jgi:hypothetical protein
VEHLTHSHLAHTIMAKSHPGLRLLTNYLRNEFPWKRNYVCKTDYIDTEFTYDEVKEALVKLKTTDPKLHRLLAYRYMSNRSRSDIAQSMYMDSSTLKRNWDKAMMILQNWLMHGISRNGSEPLIEKLEGIDIIYRDEDE